MVIKVKYIGWQPVWLALGFAVSSAAPVSPTTKNNKQIKKNMFQDKPSSCIVRMEGGKRATVCVRASCRGWREGGQGEESKAAGAALHHPLLPLQQRKEAGSDPTEQRSFIHHLRIPISLCRAGPAAQTRFV